MDPKREITDANIIAFRRCYNPSEEAVRKYKQYGPANPLWNESLEDQEIRICPYSEDGICYMLTCKCKEIDEDGIQSNDYYTGICNECKEVLPSRKYVWRTPLSHGGFVGCYCKSHYRLNIEKEEVEDNEDPFNNLCDIMELIRECHPIVETFCVPDGITISSNNDNSDLPDLDSSESYF